MVNDIIFSYIIFMGVFNFLIGKFYVKFNCVVIVNKDIIGYFIIVCIVLKMYGVLGNFIFGVSNIFKDIVFYYLIFCI